LKKKITEKELEHTQQPVAQQNNCDMAHLTRHRHLVPRHRYLPRHHRVVVVVVVPHRHHVLLHLHSRSRGAMSLTRGRHSAGRTY
jgi:hypothetical protein